MKSFSCAAILFDLDGTLIDSGAFVDRLWTRWSAMYNMDIEKVLSVVHGRTVLETLNLIAPQMATAFYIKEFEDLGVEEMKEVQEVEGAKSLVNQLPSNRWAIVTSGPRRIANQGIISANMSIPKYLLRPKTS